MMVLGTARVVEGCKTVPYVTWEKENDGGEEQRSAAVHSAVCCLFNYGHA